MIVSIVFMAFICLPCLSCSSTLFFQIHLKNACPFGYIMLFETISTLMCKIIQLLVECVEWCIIAITCLWRLWNGSSFDIYVYSFFFFFSFQVFMHAGLISSAACESKLSIKHDVPLKWHKVCYCLQVFKSYKFS